MKVKTSNVNEGFKPIVLEVTIETLEEFKTIWHRLNANNHAVGRGSDDVFNDGIVISRGTDPLWLELDSIATERNLKEV